MVNKIRKFKFIEQISENSHQAFLIEKIMFLENKIEKLYRSAHVYEFRNNISPEFISFHDVKISNVKIGVIEAMRLEIFKVRKEIIKLLKEYISKKEEVQSCIFSRMDISKGYKQMFPTHMIKDYQNIKEEDLIDYVDNSKPIAIWGEKLFNALNKLSPLSDERLNHKRTKSKFALEIFGERGMSR